MAKEREATLHEDRATLELQWKHRCLEHKGLLESIAKKNKEKERELKYEILTHILQNTVVATSTNWLFTIWPVDVHLSS